MICLYCDGHGVELTVIGHSDRSTKQGLENRCEEQGQDQSIQTLQTGTRQY